MPGNLLFLTRNEQESASSPLVGSPRNTAICRKIVELPEGPGVVPGPIYCNCTSARSAKVALHGVGGLVAHDRQEVRVGSQRELDVRVAQEFLHELRVHTLGE